MVLIDTQARDAQTHQACQVRAELVTFTIRGARLCVLLETTVAKAGNDCSPCVQGTQTVKSPPAMHPPLAWRLPGSTLADHEDLETCAQRVGDAVLSQPAYLEQLYTFSPQDSGARMLRVGYFGVTAIAELANKSLQWHPLAERPPLPAEHALIVDKAHERLAAKLHYTTLAFHFLCGSFTLSELQRIYETVWETTLDKRNFCKRILALDGLIEETGRARRNGAHRPARLYRVTAPEQVQILR